MYHYKQRDWNEPKKQTSLIIFALIFFVVAYILASNDEYKTLKADEEFYNRSQSSESR